MGEFSAGTKGLRHLLMFDLYTKPMLHLPAAIHWGTKHKSSTCVAYQKFMQGNGHEHLTTRKCGFIIHPTMGWLRASPDAMVTDPSSVLPNGIAQLQMSLQ